jgi:hypothetical protein
MTALLQNSNESQTFAKCLQMAARANDGEVYHLPTTTHKLQLATIAAFKINNIDYIIYGSNASRSPENWEGDVDLYTFKATDACHVICDTVTKMGGVVIQVVRAINVSTYRVKVFGKHFIDVSYIPEGLFTEYKKYTNEHHGANELMHYLAVARVPLFPRRCIPSTNTEQDASPKYQKALKLLHEEIPHLPPSLQHVGLSNYTMHEIRPHSDWIPGGIVALACIARACEHLPPWLAFKGRRLELPVGSPITYFRRVESHQHAPPQKQGIAIKIARKGLAHGDIRRPHANILLILLVQNNNTHCHKVLHLQHWGARHRQHIASLNGARYHVPNL